MGAELWMYYVPYEADVRAALIALRQQEFEAGRFRYSEMKPTTIAKALRNAAEDGTASILDVDDIAETRDYSVVAPLSSAEMMRLYGTDKPTRPQFDADMRFRESIERGQGVYAILYDDGGKPSEIFFGGYSYD